MPHKTYQKNIFSKNTLESISWTCHFHSKLSRIIVIPGDSGPGLWLKLSVDVFLGSSSREIRRFLFSSFARLIPYKGDDCHIIQATEIEGGLQVSSAEDRDVYHWGARVVGKENRKFIRFCRELEVLEQLINQLLSFLNHIRNSETIFKEIFE